MMYLAIMGLTLASIFFAFLIEPLFPLGHWMWGVLCFFSLLPGAIFWRRKIQAYVIKIKRAGPVLKIPDTTKGFIILFSFGFFMTGILPPVLWTFLPDFTPFFILFYVYNGVAFSHDIGIAYMSGHQLRLIHLLRMIIGLMMIATPIIMRNWIAKTGGL